MSKYTLLFLLLACGGKAHEPQGSDGTDGADGSDGSDGADGADGSSDDTGGGGPTPLTLAVGAVGDMSHETDGTVHATLTEPGDYIVILVSQAEGVGELYGYGAAADAEAVSVPSDPPPPAVHEDSPGWSALVAEGDTRSFVVSDGSGSTTIEALAVKVTDLVVYWEDQTTPNEIGTVDMATVDDVIDNFTQIVVPRERQVFGEESDVDEDERIHILLSYTVNQYGAVAYVTQCDIGATRGCGDYGNDGEIIYLGIPDPESSYSTASAITEIVAHELNHLIYGWHKYVVQDRPSASENIYLTEGMSALAQDLTGYNNGNQYVWAAAIDATDDLGPDASIDSVSVNDFLRGDSYYDYDRDGALRGGAYLYLRYLFEQSGGMAVEVDGTLTDAGGMAWLHEWFDQEALGEDTVVITMGRSVAEVNLDWYTALLVTGLVENDNPLWNFEERVEDPLTGYEFGVDPYDKIHGWLQLKGPTVQPIEEADGSIRAGGVEYLSVSITEESGAGGGRVEIPVDSAAGAVGRILRVQ